jgi:hypothetical protein
MTMDTIPQLTSQTGGERQRDMLARAEQQRRARQCRASSRTTHQAEPIEHPGLALRMMARLRMVIPHPTRQIAEAKAAEGSQPFASR